MSRTNLRRRPPLAWVVAVLTLLSFAIHLWGLRKDLPYAPEVDELRFIESSVHLVKAATLNPGWFGHPGSTIIYPLAGLFFLVHGRDTGDLFASAPASLYLAGRILVVLYSVACVPLVYRLGRLVFDPRVALAGTALSMFYVLAVSHGQVIRTDSAATFFGLLAMWRILAVVQRNTLGNQLAAGVAIGLGLSTRYFMAGLIPVLLLANALWLRRQPRALWSQAWLRIAVGLAAIPLAFALTSPYVFLDPFVALANLQREARQTHLGADGLSRPENLLWYLTQAIPRAVTWPQAVLALGGAGLIALRRRPVQWLFLAYPVGFLILISLPYLHWDRWIIQILPMIALLAALALARLVRRLASSEPAQNALLAVCVIAAAAWPAGEVALANLRASQPSTRVTARYWIVDHLPGGSRLVQERFAAALSGTDFVVTERQSLPADHTLADYTRAEFDYLVVSSAVYQRYFNEAERYPQQVEFYETLFACDCLVQEFQPAYTQAGPIIRIYAVP